jgi:hypothetical protein
MSLHRKTDTFLFTYEAVFPDPYLKRNQLVPQASLFFKLVIPGIERWLGVDRASVDVDLEVEMAADRAGVAGLPHRPDTLPRIDAIAPMDQGRAAHMGVEVAAILAFAVDQQEVAVEDRVVAATQDAAVTDGDQWRAAGGDDVEALMGAAAAARGAEFADRAARAVRSFDREDVAVIGDAAVGGAELGGGRGRKNRERAEER